ncbi:MAG: radical SAM protein [Clostridiales bacterium]|nr:radical SAM protein [Clostridiales bacterium]MCF8022016.1 radical SAM protein [Clostridiales bacterium]
MPQKEYMNRQEDTCFRRGIRITLNKKGEDIYVKSRHPVKYGCYSEIETPEAVFQFNLNNEIVGMQGQQDNWPSSLEWLKRTTGNDWVYYSTGGYSGTYESFGKDFLTEPIHFKIPSPYNEIYKAIGEYYVPNFSYISNSVLGVDPFNETSVQNLISSWYDILNTSLQPSCDFPEPFASFINEVLKITPQILQDRANKLFNIIGSRPSVLPPDTRHVDYNVIPLSLSEGCIYKCAFCEVKNNRPFSTRTASEVEKQIEQLKQLYGHNLLNYNAIFLGDHDALNSNKDFIIENAEKAIKQFGLRNSCMHGCSLYLFGSVDSFLASNDSFFQQLEKIGCRTYINLGLESADQATLDYIGKPISAKQVIESFKRMMYINQEFNNIEITANFILGDELPPEHYSTFFQLAREGLDHPQNKGTIYISPFFSTMPSRSMLFYFNQIKRLSRLPTYLYTIQRL